MSDTLITEGQQTQTAADQQQAVEGQQQAGNPAGQVEGAQQQHQAAGDQSAQGEQAEGVKPESEQEKKPESAPDTYEFKAAEGTTFDDAVIGAFSEVAKELNLSQDAAQKVLDKMAPVIASRQEEQISAAQAAWTESAKTDKEYGGDKLAENLAVAKQALDQFGTPELRTLLNDSGLGNHPEIIRAFYRAGKAISQDGFVSGAGGSSSQPDARKLYGASNMNP